MWRLTFAWILVNGLLLLPFWLTASATGLVPPFLAVDAALVVGVLALLPRNRWGRALSWAAALLLTLVALLLFVDAGFRVVLARPLNVLLDGYLASSVYLLAVGNVGLTKTLLGGLIVIVAVVAAASALGWLLRPVETRKPEARTWRLALVALFALGVWAAETPAGLWLRLATPAVALVSDQAELIQATREEQEVFGRELVNSPDSHADVPGLLTGLGGADVLFTFIESYGMAALDDPDFSKVIRPRLDSLAGELAARGLSMVTASIYSPTQGGQSWYAHGTLTSGLWLSNQLRYDLLIASDRETFVDDFRRAGYHTTVVMPAIIMSWPEGERFGYDELYTGVTMGYKGPPLYWVTMPDQFTLSFLERLIHKREDGRPRFVETALVSSHAAWTPIVPMLDWDSIGTGTVFEPFRQEGSPPEELWDVTTLRRDYPNSIAYSLDAMTEFAERNLDDRTLLVVLGDHQAAPWVTGSVSPAVPMHVIARNPALLAPFLAKGFHTGPYPAESGALMRMNEFRDWFVRAFSTPAAVPEPITPGVP